MLMHHTETFVYGVKRRLNHCFLTVEKNPAVGRALNSKKNFHQRRFSRAVFPRQRVNFSGINAQIHAVIGYHAIGINFLNPLHSQNFCHWFLKIRDYSGLIPE